MSEMDEEKKGIEPEGHVPPRYEASYLNLWTIILSLVVLFVVIVLVHFLAAGLFGIFALRDTSPQPPSPVISDAEDMTPAEVGSRLDARRMREELYADQAARISGYGWINREAGVAGIPVERAIEIISERGRPDFGTMEFTLPQEIDESDPQALVEAGAQVFQDFGCSGCHQATDTPVAPTLVGVFGTERELASGETILADEQYLEQAILEPGLHIVAGYQPIMPSFQGRLNEQQLQALIAYIVSLGEE
jgi:mono/diheme cytochrome c family protein